MEHSRLLKFFKQQRSIPDMAETPTFKVQIDYQKPENVEAEVPGSQEIREVDDNAVTVTDDYTLSPVITVTKKEATFTKGDLKLQKVTVTEDIAMEEIQNGGQSKITRTYQSLQKDGKTITRTTSTIESSHGNIAIEDKHQEEKKSKIPMLKFKQTVEKVQKEKKARKKQDDDIAKRPRKSSIPKLSKETKVALKKHESVPVLAPEDEFEKIYAELANQQTNCKVLSVKIDDPEKVESKFEELIHSYEEDDNTSVLQVEKLRQTKIPALRRRKADGDASKMSAIVNTIRLQNAVRNSREFPIEDEFGEVTTKTITTKRFGRGTSRDGSTVDDVDDSKDVKVIKTERVVSKSSKIATPVIKTVTRTGKVAKMNTSDDQDVTMTVEAHDDSNKDMKITKTTRIVKQSSRIASPVVTTVTRTEKVTQLDTDDGNTEDATLAIDAYDSNTNKELTKTTRIVKQSSKIASPVVTTVTRNEKVTKVDTNDGNTEEATMVIDAYDSNSNKELTKTTRIVKQSSTIATPVVTTVTRTEKVTKLNANDGNITESAMTIDAYNDPNHKSKEVIKTQRNIQQSSRIATPVITTVTHTEKVTQMDTDEDSTDFNQGVTTRKVVTKRTIVPEVTTVTDTEVVDTTETIITDIQDTAKNIARGRIIKEISKVNPVTTKVTNLTDNNAYAGRRDAKRELLTTVNDPVTVDVVDTNIGETENQSNDIVLQEISSVPTRTRDVDVNNEITNRKVTQTITKNTIGPVSSKEKSMKVVTTQTSLNSDNKELINTDARKDTLKIITTKELEAQSMTPDGATKEVMVTEQIVSEDIKIGIPVFTKVIEETAIDDKKREAIDRDKDSLQVTQVTRTYSQENVQNVEMNKVLDWKPIHNNTAQITNVNDGNYNKLDTSPTKQELVEELDTINTNVTKTAINETKTKLTSKDNINITEEENSTNKKETKDTVIDVNQREMKDANTLLQDKNRDIENTTVLKGNVSRLINRLSSKENREINDEAISKDGAAIDVVNQERIKRLDKMISDFNNTDLTSVDAREYDKESLSKKEKEDSVVYTQDKDIENVTIMRGNVSRLINKLGAIETETISNRGITINTLNKNDDHFMKYDEKSNQIETEHINTDTVVTVIKKEMVDTIILAHDKDSTNVIETKNEIIDSTNEIDNITIKDIKYTQRELERDNADIKLVNTMIVKEIEDTAFNKPKRDGEPDDIIKGSVSRLITKITTKKSNKPETVTKDFVEERPKKKSVLSKIAIFERLEPEEHYPRPHVPSYCKKEISKLAAKDIRVNEKPRIVDEVLKEHAKINPNDIDNTDIIGISFNETKVKVEPIVNEVWKTSFNIDKTAANETMNFKTNDNKVEISKTDANDGNIQSNIYSITHKDKVENETTENSKEIYDRVRQKYDIYEKNATAISLELNRTVSREYKLNTNNNTLENGVSTAVVDSEIRFDYPAQVYNEFNIEKDVKTTEDFKFNNENDVKTTEDFKFNNENDFKTTEDFKFNNISYKYKSKDDYKRAKSLAENDLGDAIKGKVNTMVGRLKSVDFDRVDFIKTEINIKEMPWRSSVLEKIALFEGKATAKETTEKPPRITKKAFHQNIEEIRRGNTEQGKVTAAKVPTLTTEIPPKIAANLVITEEMYQEKINELKVAKSLYEPIDVSTITLGNGIQMPVIALGTALMDPRLIHDVIGAAIDLGYRAIDTAYIYGNEKAIGDAIKAKIDDGTVKREELFIMSKLWSTFHRGDLVEGACRASLDNLGVTYIDLFMIHNPMSFKEGGDPIPRIATVLQYSQYEYLDAWFAMEKLVSQGLVRSIGVSNFNSSQIQRILDKGRVKPVVNQVECHPYLSQERLHEFCFDRNITLSCFGVLGSKGTPAEYKSSLAPVIDDPLVQVMAHGLNVTAAQLLIRYQIQSGHQAVVKSSSAAHLKDNLDALNLTLTESQMKALDALNRNKRMFAFLGMGETHKQYPFSAPY